MISDEDDSSWSGREMQDLGDSLPTRGTTTTRRKPQTEWGAILPTGDPLPTTGRNRRHGTAAATLRQQFGLEETVIIKKKT